MEKRSYELFRETADCLFRYMDLGEALLACKSCFETILPLHGIYIGTLDESSSDLRIMAYAVEEKSFSADPSWLVPLPPAVVGKTDGAYSQEEDWIDTSDPSGLDRSVADFLGFSPSHPGIRIRFQMDDQTRGVIGLISRDGDSDLDRCRKQLRPLLPLLSHRLRHALYTEQIQTQNQALLNDRLFLQRRQKEQGYIYALGREAGLETALQQMAATDKPVLLMGEAGVGKERAAHEIHDRSDRKGRFFLSVSCRRVSGGILPGELFGYAPGAFAGTWDKRGWLERARGGTLFLDEISMLPLDVQEKLLRFLQTRSIEPIGGTRSLALNVRVIAATCRDIDPLVANGTFLEELWQVLRTTPIVVPPLRMRKKVIPLLVNHLIPQKAVEMGLPVIPGIADGEMAYLQAYGWPGNIRELENVVERAVLLSQGKLIRFSGLNGDRLQLVSEPKKKQPGQLPTLDELMIQHIRETLRKTGGRIQGKGGAAELLGIHYSTLRARMKKLGIPFGRRG